MEGREIITQDKLAQYLQLKLSSRECEKLRLNLLQLHDDGAEVEAGPLDLAVSVTSQRRLTNAALVEFLGRDEVEALKQIVEPTVFRTLIVTEREADVRREPTRNTDSIDHVVL